MYISVAETRLIVGVTDTAILSDAVIEQAIKFAEDEVDRLTQTTYYPVEDSGTATAGAATTITDSAKVWDDDGYIGYAVYIYKGTGIGQIREITDNDSTSLTVATWTTNPDATSKYIITYLNNETITIDGTGTDTILVPDYPIVQVDSIKINAVTIDSDNYYIYKDTGKIILKNTASSVVFTAPEDNTRRQLIVIDYHWGVLPENRRSSISMPGRIKRFCGVIASLQALTYQMGGTYDDLSTFSLPEFSGTIGQAYINIKGTLDALSNELKTLKKEEIGKYPFMV